jgi:hypothetical protein
MRRTLVPLALILLLPACDGCDKDDTADTAPPGYASVWLLEHRGQAHVGPLAQAVPGDIVMENDRVRVTLQKPGHYIQLNPYGGNIIDAGALDEAGQAWDRFGEAGLFLNAAYTSDAAEYTIVSDGSDGAAVVRFDGVAVRSGYIDAAVGLELMMGMELPIDSMDVPTWDISTTYTLRADESLVRIHTEVTNTGSAATPLQPAWLVHGGLAEILYRGLGGFTTLPTTTTGALLPVSDETAYAFAPLPFQPGTHGSAGMAGGSVILHDASLFEVLDWPDAAAADLAPGDSYAFDNVLAMGPDLATVMEPLWAEADEPPAMATVSGQVTEQGSGLALEGVEVLAYADDTSEILAATRSDSEGAWSLELPEGPVELVWAQEGRPYADGADAPPRLAVSAFVEATQDLELPPTATLTIGVTDGDGGALPARVAIVGFDPSPPHKAFDWQDLDPMPPGVSRLLDLPPEGLTIQLEPGDYDLVFTRGMEYDAVIEPIELAADDSATVSTELHRVLDTDGWINGDFHNHAAPGPDLVLTDDERLYNTGAEGLEVRVETNHAMVTDLTDRTAELGLDPWTTSIPSQEITTFDYGHFSTFPMEYQPDLPNGGAYDWEGKSPTEIIAWAQEQDREQVIHIYHPRAIPTSFDAQNFFNVVDLLFDEAGPYVGPDAYDPMAAGVPDGATMFGPGFTAIEVMTWMNVQGLSDWFNLLSAGFDVTGTSNSDSHTTRVESSGWPRNFVYVGYDDPALLDEDGYVEAINDHRLSGSFGPLVTTTATTADGATTVMQGDMLEVDGQEIALQVRVQAAPWVPVDTLDLYADGELIHSQELELEELPGAEGGVRLEQTIEAQLTIEADTWVVAVVYGGGGMFPYVTYHTTDEDELTMEMLRAGGVTAPATPFGFANPIFFDADGDGAITPSHHIMPQDVDEYRWEDRLSPY